MAIRISPSGLVQGIGAVLVLVIAAAHIASALVTDQAKIAFVQDGFSWSVHPVYFSLVVAFWAFILVGTLINAGVALRKRLAA